MLGVVSMTLAILMLVPIVFACVVLAMPAAQSRVIALLGMLLGLGVGIYALVSFDWANAADATQLGMSVAWLPSLGLHFSLGVDSVALWLIALTALLGPLCVLGSWTAISEHQKLFYTWLLVLQTAMIGVFAARDLILFYICFEFTLIPMFVLIRMFGSTNRKAASVKFFLYTFTGSIIALTGLFYIVWFTARESGSWTFDIGVLTEYAWRMSPAEQGWVLLAMLAGFAVKVPLFPVHTWLPLAHTEAPTAGSVILAGVMLKLGTYALYRFVLGFAPVALVHYAPAIAVLCIVGILYAGLICWVQTDVKKLVAYSSVSHLGFCVLGLVAINTVGITGSVLYMLNHGLSTGALFFLIGFMYERYHTRDMRQIGGLASKMPVWASFMVFFSLASVGLPGLNGFVSEFLCMLGTFQADSHWASLGTPMPGGTWGVLGPSFAAVAALGVIVAAMYILYMVGRMCFGPLLEPAGHDAHHSHEGEDHHQALPVDLTMREVVVLLPIGALCLLLGLYPTPVIKTLEAPINQTVHFITEHAQNPVDQQEQSSRGQVEPLELLAAQRLGMDARWEGEQ